MKFQDIIETVIEKLEKYPEIKFSRTSDNELEIYPRDENGFSILLQTGERENTLHFGVYHWHYTNRQEEINENAAATLIWVNRSGKNKRIFNEW